MERIGNRRIEDFPPTTLFLDDLAEIVSVFTQACKRIEIRAGDYKLTDPGKLEALAKKYPKGRFDDIYLQGYDPYISLDLRTFGISAYISEDTLEQRGIIARIGDIVARGKKKSPAWLYFPLIYLPVLAGVWQLLSEQYLLGVALITLYFASIPFAVKYGMRNKVIIHSEPQGATKTFLERKKDDIALAVISAGLGGLITYLVTKYLP